MSFDVVPAHDIPLEQQASIANRAFAGYVGGWTELNAETLARFLLLQGADLFYSRFVREPNGLVGFGYINRTGDIARLSGMAIEPAARGNGAAAHLLLHLVEEARARGDRAMMLEVIEQNPRGHRFYLRHGFREIGRLLGWRSHSDGPEETKSKVQTEEISILDVLKLPIAVDYPTLPWQISRHAIAKLQSARGFRAGDAYVIISDPNISPIRVHSFLSACIDRQSFRNALAGVMQRFPGREFFTPAIFPEEYGTEVFQPLGFRPEPLSQFLMRLDL